MRDYILFDYRPGMMGMSTSRRRTSTRASWAANWARPTS
jgi:hypothetical protein